MFSLATAALSVGVLAACGNSSSSSDSSATTVRVGVMSLSDSEQARWDKVQEILGDEVKLEFTQFTDYSQPNKAVAENEVDINAFQHYNFLNNWNQENGEDLVAIADTYIAPIRLYSGTADGKTSTLKWKKFQMVQKLRFQTTQQTKVVLSTFFKQLV